MIKKARSKVYAHIDHIKGNGVDIKSFIDGLRDLKTDLESKGCRLEIEICGEMLRPVQMIEGKAGNGIRTHDILLGKNSVILEGADATADQSTSTFRNGPIDSASCEFLHGPDWQPTGDQFKNDGWVTTTYLCPICEVERFLNKAVVE